MFQQTLAFFMPFIAFPTLHSIASPTLLMRYRRKRGFEAKNEVSRKKDHFAYKTSIFPRVIWLNQGWFLSIKLPFPVSAMNVLVALSAIV